MGHHAEKGKFNAFGKARDKWRNIHLPTSDQLIAEADKALRTLGAKPVGQRPSPAIGKDSGQAELTAEQKKDAIGMMRVNHVGEVCAQALYQAQAMATSNTTKKALFQKAAHEETDHLAWTDQRLRDLGGRPSLLNPLWYAGAFSLGFVAGQFGDKLSLGFMAETEKQVEAHLDSHLKRLPESDQASRAVLEQMKQDEIEHGQAALSHGGEPLPLPIKVGMKLMSKVMTTLARHI